MGSNLAKIVAEFELTTQDHGKKDKKHRNYLRFKIVSNGLPIQAPKEGLIYTLDGQTHIRQYCEAVRLDDGETTKGIEDHWSSHLGIEPPYDIGNFNVVMSIMRTYAPLIAARYVVITAKDRNFVSMAEFMELGELCAALEGRGLQPKTDYNLVQSALIIHNKELARKFIEKSLHHRGSITEQRQKEFRQLKNQLHYCGIVHINPATFQRVIGNAKQKHCRANHRRRADRKKVWQEKRRYCHVDGIVAWADVISKPDKYYQIFVDPAWRQYGERVANQIASSTVEKNEVTAPTDAE